MKKRDIINKIIEDGNCDNFSCDGGAYKNVDIPCPLSKNGCNRIIGVDNNAIIKLAKQWLIEHPEKEKKIGNKWLPISEFEKHFIANRYYVFLHNDNITYSFYWFPQSWLDYFMENGINKYSCFMIIKPPKE